MSRKMDRETQQSLEIAVNTNDKIFEALSNVIDWYFEYNPKDDPRGEGDFIEWHIIIGEILDDDD